MEVGGIAPGHDLLLMLKRRVRAAQGRLARPDPSTNIYIFCLLLLPYVIEDIDDDKKENSK